MNQDPSNRYLTKISRVAQMYRNLGLRESGFNAAEYDALRYVRKRPGIGQKELAELLSVDKAAVTRLVDSLEEKGFLRRAPSPTDGRAKCLYPTQDAPKTKELVTSRESLFYLWLLEGLPPEELAAFLGTLETLYHKSKAERRAGFAGLARWEEEHHA